MKKNVSVIASAMKAVVWVISGRSGIGPYHRKTHTFYCRNYVCLSTSFGISYSPLSVIASAMKNDVSVIASAMKKDVSVIASAMKKDVSVGGDPRAPREAQRAAKQCSEMSTGRLLELDRSAFIVQKQLANVLHGHVRLFFDASHLPAQKKPPQSERPLVSTPL